MNERQLLWNANILVYKGLTKEGMGHVSPLPAASLPLDKLCSVLWAWNRSEANHTLHMFTDHQAEVALPTRPR